MIQAKSCAPSGREASQSLNILWLYHRLISCAPPAHWVVSIFNQRTLGVIGQQFITPKGVTLNSPKELYLHCTYLPSFAIDTPTGWQGRKGFVIPLLNNR
jgi:hypothetical protein